MNNHTHAAELETLQNEYAAYIKEKKKQRIKVEMVSKDVFRMDMESLRKSKKVQAQLEAARRSFERKRHQDSSQTNAELCTTDED